MINMHDMETFKTDIEFIRTSGKPVLIWGAGWVASLACEFLSSNGIDTEALIVDIPGAIHSDLRKFNFEVLAPEESAIKYSDVIVVCGFYTRDICAVFQNKVDHLARLGAKVIAYGFDLHLMMYPERRYTTEFVQSNITRFNSLARIFDDNLSRKTLAAFIKQRVIGKYGPIEPLVVSNQYFTDTVYRLSSYEVFLDCGAYDGDTIRDFTRALEEQTGDRSFRQVIAFEPNEGPFKALVENYKSDSSVICIRKGVWHEKAMLRFSGDKLRSSKLSVSGDVEIDCDCMDEIIPDAEPTLIKLDLEGAELSALRGG